MSKKRLFQIFDEMNKSDEENKTGTISVCPDVVSVNYSHNQGTKVTVGVPGNLVFDIECGKKIAVLLLIDSTEYEKRLKQ